MSRGLVESGKCEITKDYKGLLSVHSIRPAVSVRWQLLKLGFCPPTRTGRDRLHPQALAETRNKFFLAALSFLRLAL